jgi:V/A-type H+/Na+-transporting ATPase subunit D
MALRVPAGRAGRLWLVRRLELARRGAEVLDQKRQILLREEQRLSERAAGTEAEWERRAGEAAEWNARALAIAGSRRLRLAALHHGADAEVSVEWRNAVGVRFPESASVGRDDDFDFICLGGGASVAFDAQAHARALVAAAEHAASKQALEALTAELAATTRRLRAIERRWIPEHQAALKDLELRLAEAEIEETVRARWALEHDSPPRTSLG